MPGFDVRIIPKTPLYSINSSYHLYDRFDTARAAGAVNGTQAEPVGGARTVVDTNSKISIAGGKITIATGTASGADGVWWPIITRAAGKAFIGTTTPTASSSGTYFGWDNVINAGVYDAFGYRPSSALTIASAGGSLITVGTWTDTATYISAVIMRATGSFYFIKGNEYANWTLLFTSATGSMNLYPTLRPVGVFGAITLDNARIPKQIYIPVPLQSDGMSATTTDGLGNPENNGTAGNSYTNVGTWGVSGGLRSCSALSGGLGFSYLSTTSTNVMLDAVCTRSAGVTGIVARYVDANNYLIAYHDGTNAKLDKVEAGSTTNLVSAAATYSATAVTRLILDGTSARLFYNGAAVGTVATTPSAGSLNHGLYTTDTGATFDNLVIWARGNSETQYNGLNNL